MFFATFFRRKWRKELAADKFYLIRVGLCGKNGIMSSFSKVAFAASTPRESFLFYYVANIIIESFRPPFSKGGEGGGASSPSETVFLF